MRGDTYLRELERRWQVNADGDTAARYLRELERRGLMPASTLASGRTWGQWRKAEFDGRKQSNASERTAGDGTIQMMSYQTLVAVYYPSIRELHWSTDAAHSVTSARHVSRWHQELGWDVQRVAVSCSDLEASS